MVTGIDECSANSRLVLPSSVPAWAPDPREPTTSRIVGRVARPCVAGHRRVPVHDTPLHVTAVQPGVGRDLARHVAVHLVMPGQAGVLQQPDRMHHP